VIPVLVTSANGANGDGYGAILGFSALARVFAPDPSIGFARPRGLRFGSDGRLYCVGQDHVIAFDFFTGAYLGVAVQLPKLNGQAVVLWDREN
jgi:hypothetical protein